MAGNKWAKEIQVYKGLVDNLLYVNGDVGEPNSLLETLVGNKLAPVDGRSILDRAPGRLVDGQRYGYLTVDKSKSKRRKLGTVFWCDCPCGEGVYLTTAEVLKRADLSVGCMGDECPHGDVKAKVWFNPRFALWAQLNLLLSSDPDMVANEWGGSAYEGIDRATEDEGFVRYLADVWPLVEKHIRRREWWLHRFNRVLPYALDNVYVTATPDPEVMKRDDEYIHHGEAVYTFKQVADMFNVPLARILELRKQILSDAALMDRIIEEGEI